MYLPAEQPSQHEEVTDTSSYTPAENNQPKLGMTYGNRMRTPAWQSNFFPFLVKISVEDNTLIQDGLGTQISQSYIITAAHIFKELENAPLKITFWNDTTIPVPNDQKTCHKYFDKKADYSPNDICLIRLLNRNERDT